MAIKKLTTLCIVGLVLFSLATNGLCLEAYNHNKTTNTSKPRWMTSLKDSARLNQLSIPGTHDSIAYTFGGDIAYAQSMNLETQLNSGIRYLDIRLKCKDKVFVIKDGLFGFHGIANQNITFNAILDTIGNFLKNNPKEVVFARIKNENGGSEKDAACDSQHRYKTFFDVFSAYYDSSYWDVFWSPESEISNPTLGELRGKLVVMADFYGHISRNFGLRYNSGWHIQDEYHLASNWDLYKKWKYVKRHLEEARNAPQKTERGLFINYLSGSGGSFPYFVASGKSSPKNGAPRLSTGHVECINKGGIYPEFPRVACILALACGKSKSSQKRCTIAFEGTNVMTWHWLNNNYTDYTGIVVMDFPGGDLINSIIGVNDHTLR